MPTGPGGIRGSGSEETVYAGVWLVPFVLLMRRPAPAAITCTRVKDARPEGWEPAGRPHGCRTDATRPRRNPPGPGAVGHGCIVPYGARSLVGRPSAQHARDPLFKSRSKDRRPGQPSAPLSSPVSSAR